MNPLRIDDKMNSGLSMENESEKSMNIKQDRTAIFETMPVPRAVMTLVAPSILGMLVMMLYNLADTWFVGMLRDKDQTAAVNLAATVLLAFNAVNNLFGVGCSSLMGRSLGSRNTDTARRCAAFGMWGSVFSGILFSLLVVLCQDPLLQLLGCNDTNREYTRHYLFYTAMLGAMPSILNVVLGYLIRAEGRALQASIGTMSGCLINIVLDPFFILPQFLNLGAAGAGLATLISNLVACAYFLILIRKNKSSTCVCTDIRMAWPDRKIVKEVLSVGVPAAIQNLLNVTGMTILNNFTAAAAADSSAAVAAMGIAHKACMLSMYVSMGFANGANPLVAYNYGSRDYQRAKKTVVFTAAVGVLFSVCAAVLYYAFSGSIITFFMDDKDVAAYGEVFLRSMCIGMPFLAMDFIGVGVYQAFGRGMIALLFAVGRKLVLEIPAMFLLNHFFPLYGLAWAQTCAEILLGVVAVFVLRSIFNGLEKGRDGKMAIITD